MKGILWKWTNYWNGWQTRWFILDNGVLTYYKSQEEVNQGCKGSIKVSVCEIIVSNVDSMRMDIVIPGEQHLYLRAASSQERQKWLVALGTAKACVQTVNEIPSSGPDSLKVKKSELRLYCDLLMQQVRLVKTAASEKEPNVEQLNEATCLLTATCDTFINTLEDCMKISQAQLDLHSSIEEDAPVTPSNNVSQGKAKSIKLNGKDVYTKPS